MRWKALLARVWKLQKKVGVLKMKSTPGHLAYCRGYRREEARQKAAGEVKDKGKYRHRAKQLATQLHDGYFLSLASLVDAISWVRLRCFSEHLVQGIDAV